MPVNIDKNSPLPIYEQITSWMMRKITTGDWPVHYKLKSEGELASQLSVSRGTVRKAIQAMVDKKMLSQIHGKGTFVASDKLMQPLAQKLISTAEAMKAQGLEFTTIVLSTDIITPSDDLCSRLEITNPDKVFHLKRIRTCKEGEPIILIENYLNYQYFPKIEDIDFSRNYLFDVIELTYHQKIHWGKRTFSAQCANQDIAEIMQVPIHSPLLYLQQILVNTKDNPIETSDVWIRGDKFELTSILHR